MCYGSKSLYFLEQKKKNEPYAHITHIISLRIRAATRAPDNPFL